MERDNSKLKIVIFLVLAVVVIGGGAFIVFRKQPFVSPLPSESTIRVIFISPSPEEARPTASPSATLAPTKKAQPTTTKEVTATPKPTVATPSVTKAASSSATPTQ